MPARNPGEPTRRSARLRGESVASSAAASPDNVVDVVLRRPDPPKAKKAAAFNPAAVCDRLVAGDSTVRAALTRAQALAALDLFARRERDLEETVLQLAAERDLAVERLSRRRDLESAEREQRIVERVAALRAAEMAVKPSSPSPAAPSPAAPAVASPTTASPILDDPAPTLPAPSLLTPTPIPSWRRLAASIGGYLSPFAGRTSTPLASQMEPPAAPSEEPLGELTPSARKRAAPEEETPRQVRTPSAFLGPSSKNPQVPTSLSAITELTERSTSHIMSGFTNTPSRAPRSVRAVRSARQQSTTPSNKRTWQERAKQSSSSALLKYQRMRAAEREAEKLRVEQEGRENSLHRHKRVKVADLVTLPHHRPDESSSTFRVPDINSDDEMEVDEDEPVRTNVFVMAEAQVKEPPTPQAASTPTTTPKTTPRAVATLSPFEPTSFSTPEPTPRAVAALSTPGPASQYASDPTSEPTPRAVATLSTLEPASQYAPVSASKSSPAAVATPPALPEQQEAASPSAWDLFVEAYNKPVVRPSDPAAAYWFDHYCNMMKECGIPLRGPDDKLEATEAEADELAYRFMVGVNGGPSMFD